MLKQNFIVAMLEVNKLAAGLNIYLKRGDGKLNTCVLD
jgi:hypothetical protein